MLWHHCLNNQTVLGKLSQACSSWDLGLSFETILKVLVLKLHILVFSSLYWQSFTWRKHGSSVKKGKATRLQSVGFRSWSWFLAVSLQVIRVINLAVGCHYIARPAVTLATLKRAATNFAAWWTEAQWVWTVCLRLLPDSIATAIWTWALLHPSPACWPLGYRATQ